MLSTLLTRLTLAFLTPLTGLDWSIAIAIVLIYGLMALPLGLASGFLWWTPTTDALGRQIFGIFRAFFFPALIEEIGFRVWLIPHPLEQVSSITWMLWAALSLLLFIIYHPLNALSFFQAGNPTFFEPMFLLLAGLLGVACTVTYALTGSVWTVVVLHWLVVVIWLFGLGGYERLSSA